MMSDSLSLQKAFRHVLSETNIVLDFVVYFSHHMGKRKMLCHSFVKIVALLLAVCMLVQEVVDMLFELGPQVVLRLINH